MKLGISSYAFTWAIGVPGHPVGEPMTIPDLFRKAVELGVDSVQIADNMPLHKLNLNERAELKRLADDLGIDVEVGTRGLKPDNVIRYLDIAAQFDSPFLRIVIDAASFEPAIPEIVRILRQLVPEFENRGVRLAIENHDRFTAREFLRILGEAESDHIGICLDSVNSMGAGEGVHVVTELLGPHTLNLHVKEFIVRRIDHKMGFQIEGVPVGQGMLPLEWMLLKISPQCHSAVLEQWTPPEKEMSETIAKEDEWARRSMLYLKKLLKGA